MVELVDALDSKSSSARSVGSSPTRATRNLNRFFTGFNFFHHPAAGQEQSRTDVKHLHQTPLLNPGPAKKKRKFFVGGNRRGGPPRRGVVVAPLGRWRVAPVYPTVSNGPPPSQCEGDFSFCTVEWNKKVPFCSFMILAKTNKHKNMLYPTESAALRRK